MIAHREDCNPALLTELLNDRLERDRERSLTAHLEHCESCRSWFEQLTAPESWWSDTQRFLKDSSVLESPYIATQIPATEPGLAWVANLLTPTEDSQAIGTLDGRLVREVIGQGGMGVVLKVWDDELHRPLAVKLLSPMLANNGAARQRFFREAQAAAAVVHPNIVPIYTVSSESVLPYLVMPFIAGGNLQQRIERDGPLALNEILSIGLQIAEALVAAHRLGMVHRDIKPANILLDEGGHRVLLSDFGLARTIDDASLTNSGMVAGTPQFMSPEQARGDSIDHRSDLYSLGAVLYAMATGRPPVRGESTLAILRGVGEDTPVPTYDINESLPLWFDRLVKRFLEKRIDQRLSTAEQAVELLRTSLAHTRSPAKNLLNPELRESRLGKLSSLVGMLFSFVLIATLGISYWLLSNPSSIVDNQRAMSNPNSRAEAVQDLATLSSTTSLEFQSNISEQLTRIHDRIQSIRRTLEVELQSGH